MTVNKEAYHRIHLKVLGFKRKHRADSVSTPVSIIPLSFRPHRVKSNPVAQPLFECSDEADRTKCHWTGLRSQEQRSIANGPKVGAA